MRESALDQVPGAAVRMAPSTVLPVTTGGLLFDGGAGPVLSVTVSEVVATLPAASVVLTSMVWGPSWSAEVESCAVQLFVPIGL